MRPIKPHKADGYWYLIRRVPVEFAHLDARKIVRLSTGIRITDDPRGIAARPIVEKLNASLASHWKALRDGGGDAPVPPAPFEEIRTLARRRGFEYAPAAEVADQNLEAVLARIESLLVNGRIEQKIEVAAVLGGAGKEPPLRVSDLFNEFEKLMRATIEPMSPTQKRKWPAPYRRAEKNLLMVIGEDKALADLTRDDGLDFRDFWQDRIVEEGMNISSANREIGAISRMVREVSDAKRLSLPMFLDKLRIKGLKKGHRNPFETEFIQDVLFAEETFDELNEEARHLIYLIAETGLRPSEACFLDAKTIHLRANVPHVSVRPDGRVLKAEASERDIPLVGAALEVMRLHPNGFPRYRDNADALSALVNKSMKARKLRKPGQTLYSLRHSFEDRLTAVEAPEKVVATLMGHAWVRPKYGAGPSLTQLQSWLERIALRPPVRL